MTKMSESAWLGRSQGEKLLSPGSSVPNHGSMVSMLVSEESMAAALRSIRDDDIEAALRELYACLRVSRLQQGAGDNTWTRDERVHLCQCEKCRERVKHFQALFKAVAAGVDEHQQGRQSSRVRSLPFVGQELWEHRGIGGEGISILVADGHNIVRCGLRVLLESQPGWKIVAEAGSGREAVSKAIELRPDIIVLDVALPELNGLDAARLILKALPQNRVLILTANDTKEMIERAFQAGVQGYVLKADAEADLVAATRALLHGRTFFTSAAAQVMVERLRRGQNRDLERPALTVREAEIVQLLAEGHSNKEVAGILNISARTVENHRAQIMQRLGLHSFSELIRYAIRAGMVEP